MNDNNSMQIDKFKQIGKGQNSLVVRDPVSSKITPIVTTIAS